ncbi:hypothetical protein T02_11805 [Trichinella nativa]|uniref:Uncharacterized protein n=1 Tax=Trichinella nativa TaxID=6335 RepID=A0A0V1LBE4_9BILA|nr:hypothetical protein T02_11805 [Trichinella nativa]
MTCAHMLQSIELILNPKCLNFKYLSLEDPEADRMLVAGHGLGSLYCESNFTVLQCSCLSIESHSKDKFHFAIWKLILQCCSGTIDSRLRKIIIILSIYRKLFLSTNNKNILRHSVLHSNVACKLRIEGKYIFLKPAITSTASIPLRGCKEYDVQREKEQREKELAMHVLQQLSIRIQVYLFCFGEENDNLTLSE